MTLLVGVIGLLIVALGLLGLANPDRFRALFEVMNSRTRFLLAIGIRLALGALLWWLADSLKHPQVMRILAGIAVFAAAGLILMGRERLDKLVGWWLGLPDGLLRVSAAFAAAFGAYLAWAAF